MARTLTRPCRPAPSIDFRCVDHQIVQGLLQLHRIGADPRYAFIDGERQADAALAEIAAQQFRHLREGTIDVDNSLVERALTQKIANACENLGGALALRLDLADSFSRKPGIALPEGLGRHTAVTFASAVSGCFIS